MALPIESLSEVFQVILLLLVFYLLNINVVKATSSSHSGHQKLESDVATPSRDLKNPSKTVPVRNKEVLEDRPPPPKKPDQIPDDSFQKRSPPPKKPEKIPDDPFRGMHQDISGDDVTATQAENVDVIEFGDIINTDEVVKNKSRSGRSPTPEHTTPQYSGTTSNDREKNTRSHSPPKEFTTSSGAKPKMSQNIRGRKVQAVQAKRIGTLRIGDIVTTTKAEFDNYQPSHKHPPAEPSAEPETQLPEELLTSTAKITDEMIYKVTEGDIGYRWRELGYALRISYSTIRTVQAENPNDSLNDLIIRLLMTWRQTIGNDATVGKLARALEKIGCYAVALKLLSNED